MRRLIVAIVAIVAGLAAQASYLHWQVNTANISSIEGYSSGTSYKATLYVGTVAADGTKTVTANLGTTAVDSGDQSYVSVDSYSGSSPAYSFWIEVASYTQGSSGSTFFAMSETPITYANLGNYITSTMTSIPTAWTGGTMTNAPEPTSGLLLLVGGALLALRRKRA